MNFRIGLFEMTDDGSVRVGKAGDVSQPAGPVNGFWSDADWLFCRDGKWRPVEPGIFPLVDGISKSVVRGGDRSMAPDANQSAEARTMRLKGYGNAIVPQVAAIFITATMQSL